MRIKILCFIEIFCVSLKLIREIIMLTSRFMNDFIICKLFFDGDSNANG